MLYRGQRYGAPVGEWWTTSLHQAEQYAMSRGQNRTYVVLALDEDPADGWLTEFRYADGGPDRGATYRIPLARLAERWRGVRVHSGAITLEGRAQDGDPVCATSSGATS
jgi:hypothetical protein